MSISAPMSGITPYVGAGAGFTYVSWGDLNDTTYCVDGGRSCPDPLAVGSTVHGGDDGWRFTYAFMAGFAYDLTHELQARCRLQVPQHRRRRHVRLGFAAAHCRRPARRAPSATSARSPRSACATNSGRPAIQISDIERRALARRFRFRCARNIVRAATEAFLLTPRHARRISPSVGHPSPTRGLLSGRIEPR